MPEGRLEQGLFRDARSGRERAFWLYRALGDSTTAEPALLVLCDGEGHLELGVMDVLDNLVADGRIPPLVCLLLHHPDREVELTCNDAFAEELATQLLPRVRGELCIPALPSPDGDWRLELRRARGGVRGAAPPGGLRQRAVAVRLFLVGAGSRGGARVAHLPLRLQHRRDVRFYLNVGLLERGPSPRNSPEPARRQPPPSRRAAGPGLRRHLSRTQRWP